MYVATDIKYLPYLTSLKRWGGGVELLRMDISRHWAVEWFLVNNVLVRVSEFRIWCILQDARMGKGHSVHLVQSALLREEFTILKGQSWTEIYQFLKSKSCVFCFVSICQCHRFPQSTETGSFWWWNLGSWLRLIKTHPHPHKMVWIHSWDEDC